MSSRNLYLSPEERKQAPVLNRGLQKARACFSSGAGGCTRVDRLISVIRQEIGKAPLAKIEYVEILDSDTLENIHEIKPSQKALAAVAVKFGKTRLIDNTILNFER